MVLGLRSKSRKVSSIDVEYVVHVQDIKPWPASKSMKSVLLRWESDDEINGLFTSSSVGDQKIDFNDYFRLPATLYREGKKSKTHQSFLRHNLEFNLYEARIDEVGKDQLLGSAVVNIAEYGYMKESTTIYVPLDCKKSFKNTVQPVLFLKIMMVDGDGSNSSSKVSFSGSLDNDGSQSAAEFMSGYEETDYDDDDCDISSRSSRDRSSDFDATRGSVSQKKEVGIDSNKQETTKKKVSLRCDTLPVNRSVLVGVQGSNNVTTNRKLQSQKSVQFPSDSAKIKQLISINKAVDKKEKTNVFDECKAKLESKVEMLEEELREAAAVESGLYSVVAEHGSSVNKVHTPARRLSRLYNHACKVESPAKQACAARASVSGLILVSKACGNDVPRLTFWLSNSIVLRATVRKAIEELYFSAGKEANKSYPSKGNEFFPIEKAQNNSRVSYDEWEDPQMFIVALEKIEAWIFSRIVESIWWQTLTPHMQSAAAKGSTKKTHVKKNGLGDQKQGNFSIDLWKKAFKDACERLCPIRVGGHECGCLPVLARLVMEQLVDRLDVAMFNAILRESSEDMPTDPLSDPICDSRVLPIPSGKSSFGSGAQLKNAVGNWSKGLIDLVGIDHDSRKKETSFKGFRLLNALGDLMMLPMEMLVDRSIREEVCPIFGIPLIKRALHNFVPDEFCPKLVPNSVFETLDSEDSSETVGVCISSFPVSAAAPVYSPPHTGTLAYVVGEVKKSYTSDEELDELDCPMSSIIGMKSRVSASSTGIDMRLVANGGRTIVRYQLLRDVWTTEKS